MEISVPLMVSVVVIIVFSAKTPASTTVAVTVIVPALVKSVVSAPSLVYVYFSFASEILSPLVAVIWSIVI